MERTDGRKKDKLRPIKITRHYTKYAEGSVLIEMGDTKVLCTASVEESVPPFKKDSGEGWVTAEYSMLPRATSTRNKRDISKLKLNGRSGEIQRLIGRSLRASVDMKKLGERTITIDCDVLQADGGTRCASITGGFVALYDALTYLKEQGLITKSPLKSFVSAVSVGIKDNEVLLDLCYKEDSSADVDMNFVMNDKGEIIEVQGTAEGKTFSKEELDSLYALAKKGIKEITKAQKNSLKE